MHHLHHLQQNKNGQKRCLIPLVMFYLMFMMSSQILSYRYVNIGSVLTVASVFVIPLTYSISDLISEVYGYSTMRLVIWMMLIVTGVFAICITALTHLPVSLKFTPFTEAYSGVFHSMIRVYLSNFIGIVLGMFLNAYLLVKWKILLKGRVFFLRSLFASGFGELIFTSIVVFLVQVNVTSLPEIIEMITVSFAIKVIFTIFSAFLIFLLKPLILYIEGRDMFEVPRSYNPLRFG